MSKNVAENKEQFYQAIKNDTYAEYVLKENPKLVVITDWEGDGYFYPYVVVPSDYENEQEVDDLLCEQLPEIPVMYLERQEQNNLAFYHIDTKNIPENLDI